MKNLIKSISTVKHIVSINGNWYNFPEGLNYNQVESYYRYFQYDQEFIEMYFHQLLNDDPDNDYELSFHYEFRIELNDGGVIDIIGYDDESGMVNTEIREISPNAKILNDHLERGNYSIDGHFNLLID